MNTSTRSCFVALTACILAAAPSVLAQTSHVERGVELEADLSGDGFLHSPYTLVGPGVGMAGWVGYRASSHWSVGAFGGYQRHACNASGGCGDLALSTASVGLGARWRPLRAGRVTPWLSAGIAWGTMAVRETIQSPSFTDATELSHTASMHALVVPVSLGLDVAVVRGLSVVASASVAPWLMLGGCDGTDARNATTTLSTERCEALPSAHVLAALAVAWSAGVGVRYTFGL